MLRDFPVPSSGVTRRDPVPIQVVFQGGGAKLCVLMAVCEVLQEYQTDNRIKINRLAGSSAGAIAAAMLGFKKKKVIGTFKSDIKRIGPLYLAKMKVESPRLEYWLGKSQGVWVAKRRAAWRVYRGGPYFTGFDLKSFFEELFDNVSNCENLEPETSLYYTDLYSLSVNQLGTTSPWLRH